MVFFHDVKRVERLQYILVSINSKDLTLNYAKVVHIYETIHLVSTFYHILLYFSSKRLRWHQLSLQIRVSSVSNKDINRYSKFLFCAHNTYILLYFIASFIVSKVAMLQHSPPLGPKTPRKCLFQFCRKGTPPPHKRSGNFSQTFDTWFS